MMALVIAWAVVCVGVMVWLMVAAAGVLAGESRWHLCRGCGRWVNECGDRTWLLPSGAARGGTLVCDECARARNTEVDHD